MLREEAAFVCVFFRALFHGAPQLTTVNASKSLVLQPPSLIFSFRGGGGVTQADENIPETTFTFKQKLSKYAKKIWPYT